MKKITTKIIAEAFVESLDKKLEAADARVELVYKLLKKNKLGSRVEIFLKDVEELLDKKNGTIKASVVSKDKLSSSDHNKLKTKLIDYYKTDKIKLDERVDEKVLGGVRIKVGDEVWDSTVLGRFNELTNIIRN